MKNSIGILCIFLFISVLAGCSNKTESLSPIEEPKGKIKVGAKYFTEQLLLAKITSIYLQEHGYEIEEISHMGSTPIRSALENGLIDLYWEYTATAILVHESSSQFSDFDHDYENAREQDKKDGLLWLDHSEINNTYALLMREELANVLQISTLSDLAEYMNSGDSDLLFGTEAEFYSRLDGVKGLEEHYDFHFPKENIVRRDTGLLYDALREGQVDIAVGFATDARIKGFNLTILEDDQSFFLPYYAFPVVRSEVYTSELNELMNQLVKKLDSETMTTLNHAVDMEYKDIAEISRLWLIEQGLIH
ncbi:glycine betaine ABC transporter substrate-binding protein [Anaerobacillus sp. MEB173]|uniref:glycine betaine ABC transporter substrate-binding protein n=1 Tax=Anaerobacillus sp. MEB173 TaxID=3383345 RepID=UPI003F8E730B